MLYFPNLTECVKILILLYTCWKETVRWNVAGRMSCPWRLFGRLAVVLSHKYIDDSSEPLLIVVWITNIIQLWSAHTNILMTTANLKWKWSGSPISSSSELHTQIYWRQQQTIIDSVLDHYHHLTLICTHKYTDDNSKPQLIVFWLTTIT